MLEAHDIFTNISAIKWWYCTWKRLIGCMFRCELWIISIYNTTCKDSPTSCPLKSYIGQSYRLMNFQETIKPSFSSSTLCQPKWCDGIKDSYFDLIGTCWLYFIWYKHNFSITLDYDGMAQIGLKANVIGVQWSVTI